MQPTVGGMEKELCVRHMMRMRIPSIIADCHVDESIDDRKKFSHVDYLRLMPLSMPQLLSVLTESCRV